MLKKVEGIVLSEVAYGDTSKIINIVTEFGLKGIICKGAMNIKNKNRVSSMKLSLSDFNIYDKEDKLSILGSSDIIDNFSHIRSDILLISYASYLCDLVYQTLKQIQNDKYYTYIYDNFKNALIAINKGLNPMVITNILEVKLLDSLGVGLNLTSCTICGNKKEIVTLSSERGGLICKNCYHGERIIPLSIIKVINNFLSNYYDDYTGLYLKSKNFLKTIAKL